MCGQHCKVLRQLHHWPMHSRSACTCSSQHPITCSPATPVHANCPCTQAFSLCIPLSKHTLQKCRKNAMQCLPSGQGHAPTSEHLPWSAATTPPVACTTRGRPRQSWLHPSSTCTRPAYMHVDDMTTMPETTRIHSVPARKRWAITDEHFDPCSCRDVQQPIATQGHPQ